MHNFVKYDFFRIFKKISKKFCSWAKKNISLSQNDPNIYLSSSGDLKAQLEGSFDILNPLLFEKCLKNCAQSNFSGELGKKP